MHLLHKRIPLFRGWRWGVMMLHVMYTYAKCVKPWAHCSVLCEMTLHEFTDLSFIFNSSICDQKNDRHGFSSIRQHPYGLIKEKALLSD